MKNDTTEKRQIMKYKYMLIYCNTFYDWCNLHISPYSIREITAQIKHIQFDRHAWCFSELFSKQSVLLPG